MSANPLSYYPVDGRYVRGLRRVRTLSVEELAERAGLSVDTVKRIENQGRPRHKYGCQAVTVRLLAAALDCEPVVLLSGSRA